MKIKWCHDLFLMSF